jgi:hypothetical protein
MKSLRDGDKGAGSIIKPKKELPENGGLRIKRPTLKTGNLF